MLIPNLKFLVLPLIALAVIAALPSAQTDATPQEARTVVSPAKIDCARVNGASHCMLATGTPTVVVR
jgi:hypothetical protein